jgi:outer membrane autotransporter protein
LYASWGTVSWFGDLNLGYGRSSISDTSGTIFDTKADYSANQLGFHLGGGKEMVFRDDRLFVTPTAAFSGYYYLQDSYVETSTTAVPRRVDEYDYLSLQSDLGLKVSYTSNRRRSVLVPEVHANWLHEFNADEQRIDYSLVGGTGRYSFGMHAPLEDIFEAGTGVSWWVYNRERKAFEWYAGLDGRFGDGYVETIASLRLLGQF